MSWTRTGEHVRTNITMKVMPLNLKLEDRLDGDGGVRQALDTFSTIFAPEPSLYTLPALIPSGLADS